MDSTQPSLDTVYQAVFALYNNVNPSDVEQADLWLKQLQKSVYAWKISDEMLQQKKDLESCYFAAQTMRSKIQESFQELPIDSHISLRDSLLEHISQINKNTNAAIVVQLCCALADLILQMATWQEPIIDLFQKFGNNADHMWPLLEILIVLPEEVNSRYIRLGANRRAEIVKNFTCYGDNVLQFLIDCPKKDDNVLTYCKILKCSTTWISIHAISITAPLFSHIITLAFQILQDNMTGPQLHEAAADCVSAILQVLEEDSLMKRDENGDPIVPLQQLQLDLFTRIVNLEQAYHVSVAHEDMHKSTNYCRIFTELAETFLETIVNGSINGKQHYAIKALDFALICVGHYDYEVAQITFNLWYRLSEIIYQRENDELSFIFKPYIERLIGALCRHCQMEPDHLGLIEEGDGFAEFRTHVFELIKDVVFIVGSSHCFRQMFNTITTGSGSQGETTWEVTEAALFVMKAVAKNILPGENDVVPKVVEAILNLPENTHIAVRHTSTLLLGELCEWIDNHPQTLEPILDFLLTCLNQKGLGGAASEALHSICTTCSKDMVSHIQGLLHIAQSVDSYDINNDSAISILKGVSKVLSSLPLKDIQKYMKQLCWFQAKPLEELLNFRITVEKGTKKDPVVWLDRLAAIFRHTSPIIDDSEAALPGFEHPGKEAANEIWPVLSNLFTIHQQDVRIMERCCRCIRFIVRCLGRDSVFLLERLVKQMVDLYTVHQHSCFLYLGSILVDEFGTNIDYVAGLLGMLEAFIGPTFTLLRQTDGLKNHPDTVDDLFRLCARFLQTSPVPLLHSSMMNNILECALLSCSLDHREANASVMKFFYDLIHSGRCHENRSDFTIRRKLLNDILQNKGQDLVTSLIHAAVYSLSSYTLPDIANIIIELSLASKEHTSLWLQYAISQMPTENAGGSQTAKPEQLIEFHNIVTTADSSKTVAHALRNFTRLYR